MAQGERAKARQERKAREAEAKAAADAAKQERKAREAEAKAAAKAAKQEGRTARAGSGRADAAWSAVTDVSEAIVETGGEILGGRLDAMDEATGDIGDESTDDKKSDSDAVVATVAATDPVAWIKANPIPAAIGAGVGLLAAKRFGLF